jgi:MOSC domain-containing protein YiiM
MNPTVENIFITKTRREQPHEIEAAKLEAGKGIVGDRYHERALEFLAMGDQVPSNHISVISKEELAGFLERNNAEIDYADFRRNVLISGIDLRELIGRQFKLGSALCQGIEDCDPCAFLAATVHHSVLPEMKEKAGLRAIILEDGDLKIGDTITMIGD